MNKFFICFFVFLTACSSGGSNIQAEDPEYLLGNPDAPVRIVEFSDLECPACGGFHKGAFQHIKKKYIDTGKASYRLKDFPLPIHGQARDAAQAAYCAGEQDQYWEMINALFQNQPNFSKGDLIDYANNLDLNSNRFEQCIDAEKYTAVIEANMQEGINRGVGSTPTIFFNDIRVNGNYPLQAYEEIMKRLLNE